MQLRLGKAYGSASASIIAKAIRKNGRMAINEQWPQEQRRKQKHSNGKVAIENDDSTLVAFNNPVLLLINIAHALPPFLLPPKEYD